MVAPTAFLTQEYVFQSFLDISTQGNSPIEVQVVEHVAIQRVLKMEEKEHLLAQHQPM